MGTYRLISLLPILAVASVASSQVLTLERALNLAHENNGNVKSAYLQYEASKANARAAFASYLPTVTPSYQYRTSRLHNMTGTGTGVFNSVSSDSMVTASWLLLDSGERKASFRQSSLSRDSSQNSALLTLRQVLFGVHTSFYESLRSDELLKVRTAQLNRAQEIEKQTIEFADTGAGARKDILQAKADALNAKASELTARNRVTNATASLRAVLGIEKNTGLGTLVAPQNDMIEAVNFSLDDAIQEGLRNRPDLAAQRFRIMVQEQSVRLSKINSGMSWTVNATYSKAFSQDAFENSALVFQFSIPLYDGNRSKEVLRSNNLILDAERATLQQGERDALAEIESAYIEFSQNLERLDATEAARDASQINYDAVFESRQEGASELIELLTAQVSLATAESNYIEARYDTLISRVRLDLATGNPLPGEKV